MRKSVISGINSFYTLHLLVLLIIGLWAAALPERKKVNAGLGPFRAAAAQPAARHTVRLRARPAVNQGPIYEQAVAASDFIDSIGVNVPIDNEKIFRGMLALLRGSGIRHVRVGICKTLAQCSFYKALEAAGLRGTVIEDAESSSTQITKLLLHDGPLAMGSFVEALEGINEPNNPEMPWYTPQWASHTRSQQQILWHAVKDNAATAQILVLGPSICCNYIDQQKVGDLSAFLDVGSMHDYFGAMNPGSIYYTGVYAIDFQRAVQAAVSGTKPIFSTETGWGTNGSRHAGEVDASVQLKYVLRGFLEHRIHHVNRVFDFLLVDDPLAGAAYQSYGLAEVSSNGELKPKPSFVALRNLVALLQDGSSFVPTGLRLSMSGDGASVDHLLLQKADGSFDLIIWAEVPDWSESGSRPITYAPQRVEIDISTPIASAELFRFGLGGAQLEQEPLQVAKNRVTLDVTDTPEVIHLMTNDVPGLAVLPPVNPGDSFIENRQSGLCLFVVNASVDPGSAVGQSTCTGVRNQQFTVSKQADGFFLLRDANSRNCLRAAALLQGSSLQTGAGCSPVDASQNFALERVGARTYIIVSRPSGLCIGAPGESRMTGAQMQVMICNGGISQRWIVPDLSEFNALQEP